MDRKLADLHHVNMLVLDEADRTLDMGFHPSVRRILSRLGGFYPLGEDDGGIAGNHCGDSPHSALADSLKAKA